MNRGKQTCKILKEIRQQIANDNDIEFAIIKETALAHALSARVKCAS